MTKGDKIYQALLEVNPDPKSELIFKTPFECLVCVMLSAQCLDRTVNLVTPELFKKFPTPQMMQNAKQDEVEELIKKVNFYRNKAKHLIETSKILCEKFDGVVPDNIDDLMALKGVSRKTAQVVLVEAFKQPAVPVDTHIFRVINRVFGQNFKKPIETENFMRKNFKEDQFEKLHKMLVLHGRYVCQAKKPNCENCCLKKLCEKGGEK